MSVPSSKMKICLYDKQWKENEGNIYQFPALHLLISVFDREWRIIFTSQHRGTCSLMHIDARIKANQAGREAGITLTIPPPIALPPCSHLFVPVLKQEHRTCPAGKHSPMIEGRSLRLVHPYCPSLSSMHPPAAAVPGCVQLHCCILLPESMRCPAGVRLSRLRIDKFRLEQYHRSLWEEAVCCHSICPIGICGYISAPLSLLPPTSTTCPNTFPSPLLLPGWGLVLSQCLGGDRCILTGFNSLSGVTSGSPLPHFLCSTSPRGCHSQPDRWMRGRRKAMHKSFSHRSNCMCVENYRLEIDCRKTI